ncbi:LysR family transcriptional regulator [Arenibacterium sp. LLYu02]|uniref:LysR family transcriptional regulator n=1 Tax=Arenibacterium sp. LLYu02 TaxID=3404132 RepID=UPI003B20FF26
MVRKNYRDTLPPLDALVFFEAAARHHNFSRAAEELSVSQTAVSKRIKQLEAHLGCALFLRDGRKLTLTREGEVFAEKCEAILTLAVQSLPRPRAQNAPLHITCCSAIAPFWLDNRLSAFLDQPDAPVIHCVTTDEPDHLLNPSFDLTLLYGTGKWEGWDSRPLFDNIELPVATSPINAETPILIDAQSPKQGPRWIHHPDFPNLKLRSQIPCPTYADTLTRAKAGAGIALASQPLIASDLQAGTLQPLAPARHNPAETYHIAWPQNRPLTPAVEALRDHLLRTPPSSF